MFSFTPSLKLLIGVFNIYTNLHNVKLNNVLDLMGMDFNKFYCSKMNTRLSATEQC
jgi:hypothetical protein